VTDTRHGHGHVILWVNVMKVLTAMYTLKRGGSYDRFNMMIESFLEKQWEVHCLSLTPIQIEHSCYHNHVIMNPFRIRRGWVAKFIVLFLLPIYSFLIGYRKKIDLLVVFGPLYAFLLAIPKLVLKRPMVTLIRLNPALGHRVKGLSDYLIGLNQVIEYIGLRFSDRIIASNETICEEIINIFGRRKNKIEVLYNNIPSIRKSPPENIFQRRNQLGISNEAKLLVTAGILTPRKNFEILLRCFPKIKLENLFLLIAGDSSTNVDLQYKNFLKELSKTLGLSQRVLFLGWLEKKELWEIYHASDLFVLPSLNEGMPNALLEALGSDLPCLGSNIPGIKDILQYNELLFDPRDEIDLVNKIRRIFSDDQFFNQMKRLCEERKEAFNFDWKERLFQTVTTGFNG
jgi:glycosyltransferase involved in cell wall biosynthesis